MRGIVLSVGIHHQHLGRPQRASAQQADSNRRPDAQIVRQPEHIRARLPSDAGRVVGGTVIDHDHDCPKWGARLDDRGDRGSLVQRWDHDGQHIHIVEVTTPHLSRRRLLPFDQMDDDTELRRRVEDAVAHARAMEFEVGRLRAKVRELEAANEVRRLRRRAVLRPVKRVVMRAVSLVRR